MKFEQENFVSSELGQLKKILIHSPDGGIGKIVPSKFEDWLYDDTVQHSKMRKEYDDYVRILLYFLDPEKAEYVQKYLAKHDGNSRPDCYKPGKSDYFNSEKVIEVQNALGTILENQLVRLRLISAICAVEGCNSSVEAALEKLNPNDLAKSLISGNMQSETGETVFIFPPVPNLVFTRDISIMIKDHVLLSKFAKQARKRETIITKYILRHHPAFFKNANEKVIEISDESNSFLEEATLKDQKVATLEGGDVMMISEHHVMIGCSERTSATAVNAVIHALFSRDLEIEKISVVKIPHVRAQMHIDTIFTMIRRDAWVMYGAYSEKVAQEEQFSNRTYHQILEQRMHESQAAETHIYQFKKEKSEAYNRSKNYFYRELDGLEELLILTSVEDFGIARKDVKIVYSANNEFPYNDREQWTDSCNLLALKEGLVIGYDRNEKTIEAFKSVLGFEVYQASDLIELIEAGKVNIQEMENTLILLSSTELSRARGGSHCMSNPLIRGGF